MRKVVLSTILIVLCILTLAQAPESFNYQAVVRDASNNPITDKAVSFRISILKGGVSGSEEYVETHSTSTNSLGLVTLAIGNGTDKTGDLATIDWGADSYYLKVEIDPIGGTSYVEMGTTQLLSVPYAISASNIVARNEFGKYYKLKINDLGTVEWEYISPNTVFIIDFNGPLYVYPEDNSSGVLWDHGSTVETFAISNTDGKSNTDSIVKYLGPGAYAAYLCDTLNAYGYNDWYLPAKDELNAIYLNKSFIGGFSPEDYWSSTEYNVPVLGLNTWTQNFINGIQSYTNSNSFTNYYRVRCVRRD